MAEVGPDGCVWVIDWYNYIVQHNPTPQGFRTGKGAAYETDLRDKKHARIYRIVYDGATKPSQARFSLHDSSPEKLVQALRHDNMFWRKQAQRLLVERGQRDVVPALVAAVGNNEIDAIGLNAGVIHALWALHGLGALNGSEPDATAAALAALKHPSAGVRRNALQVLPLAAQSTSAILAANLVRDPDFQVRLAALLALADLPASENAAEAITAVLKDPQNVADRWIAEAATCAAAKNSEQFLGSIARSTKPTSKLVEISGIVAGHYARGRPGESISSVIAGLIDADPRIRNTVIHGLSTGWPEKSPPPVEPRLVETLERLLPGLDPASRGDLIKLARNWGINRFDRHLAEVGQALLERVGDSSQTTDARLSAARELVAQEPSNSEYAKSLIAFITPRQPPEFAVGLLQAVSKCETPAVAPLVLEQLEEWTPNVRGTAVGILLSRTPWTAALLDAVEQRRFAIADLSLVQKQALAEHADAAIRNRARTLLTKGGVLPDPDRQKILDGLLSLTKEKGDVAAGQRVFKAQCAKCHIHGAEGERIGPDLTGMAVHSKEHLLTDIIDPNRSVEANYRQYTVQLKKGTYLTGMLAAESRTAVDLVDTDGKKITVLRDDIEKIASNNKSLMPDGFEKQVSRTDLGDLLEFLAYRGRFLPLPLEKAATVISTRGMFFSESSQAERLVFDDWNPRTFNGVPFRLIDPRGDRVPNVILLYGPQGQVAPRMPKSVTIACNSAAKAIHILGGISGWGFPLGEKGSTSLTVRLHYADDQSEDHPLRNGDQIADYIRRVDVPGSTFAFDLHGRQLRYLAIMPQRQTVIKQIELVKGRDATAPIVVAITVETPN
jgi:putative heme-binding domain-containing protein